MHDPHPDDDHRAWLTALRTPGLGPGGLRQWLDRGDGDIHAALAQLRRDGAGLDSAALAWLEHPDEARLAQDLAWLAEPGHRLLRCTDADFPPHLEQIPHPPAGVCGARRRDPGRLRCGSLITFPMVISPPPDRFRCAKPCAG